MSFVAGLRQALDLRQSDVVSELSRGDSLEEILNRHLLTVERMTDREILTSILLQRNQNFSPFTAERTVYFFEHFP